MESNINFSPLPDDSEESDISWRIENGKMISTFGESVSGNDVVILHTEVGAFSGKIEEILGIVGEVLIVLDNGTEISPRTTPIRCVEISKSKESKSSL